jgi:leucyl aminopeptidase
MLGDKLTTVFSNDDVIVEKLIKYGKIEQEPFFRVPLVSDYKTKLCSEIGDINNISTEKDAGAIIAALFIQHFVKNTPWIHLDLNTIKVKTHGTKLENEAIALRSVYLLLNELSNDSECLWIAKKNLLSEKSEIKCDDNI